MAYTILQVAPTEYNSLKKLAYEYEEELSASGNGKWVLIPADIESVVVSLIVAGGGQGKVQSSTDLISVIKSGSGITAFDWALGAVGSNIQDVAKPCNALRVVQTSVGGTVKIQINAR